MTKINEENDRLFLALDSLINSAQIVKSQVPNGRVAYASWDFLFKNIEFVRTVINDIDEANGNI